MKSQSSFLLVIMFTLLTMFSCEKEYDLDTEVTPLIEEASLRGDKFKSEDGIISEFQNEIYKKINSNLLKQAGQENFDCIIVDHSPEEFSIVILPFLDKNEKVKNLLYGIKFKDGSWKYRLINKKYYQYKAEITIHSTNKFYYASLLKTMEIMEERIENGCQNEESAESRCEDIMLCAANFIAHISCQTGVMTITDPDSGCPGGGGGSNGGCGGCSQGINITTVYVGGAVYWESSDNSDDPGVSPIGDWNPDEDNGISNPINDDGPFGGGGSSGNICVGSAAAQVSDLDNIIEGLVSYITENNITGHSPYQLLDMMEPECATAIQQGDASCMNASILCRINENYNLLSDEALCLRNSPQISLDINSFLNGNTPNRNYIVDFYLRLICEMGIDISINSFAEIVYTDHNFEDQEEFDEFVSYKMVEVSGGPGILTNRTCKSSFEFKSVGLGWTAQVENIPCAYDSNAGYYSYRIGELCIQISGTDANNVPLTKEKAAELSAFALDNAKLKVFKDIEEEIVSSDNQAREAHRRHYKDQLSILTGGRATASISFAACNGNIPIRPYKSRWFFGLGPCVTSY